MMKHLQIVVSGKVQGVYFRRDTQLEARRLGVNGTVANQDDGSVVIEVEGDEIRLEAFVRWCHSGPKLANVTNVQTKEGKVIGFTSFEVLADPSDYLG